MKRHTPGTMRQPCSQHHQACGRCGLPSAAAQRVPNFSRPGSGGVRDELRRCSSPREREFRVNYEKCHRAGWQLSSPSQGRVYLPHSGCSNFRLCSCSEANKARTQNTKGVVISYSLRMPLALLQRFS